MATYRPTTEADLPQSPLPLESYTAKLQDLTTRCLPYIVAVDKSQKREDGSDLVLGYASFSPFRGHLLSYAPTVELSLFVHPDFQSRSIGSNLLNYVLNLLQKGEVNQRCKEGPNKPLGSPTRVLNVIAVMAVDPEGKDGGEALRRWYIQRGFVQSGRMVNVGFKRGKWIDTVYLQYSTLEQKSDFSLLS